MVFLTNSMSQRIEELLQTVVNREQRLEQLDRNLREARDRFQDEQVKRQSAEQDLARMAAGDEVLHLRDENISALESKVEYEKERCKQAESQHNDAQAENNVCEAYNALLTTVEHASHELRKSVSSLVSTASTGGVVDDTKEASMGNKLEESVSAALETIQFLTERVRQLEQDKAELHEGERDDGNNCNKRADELEEELQKQANAVNETYQALEMKQLELDSLKGALEDARRCEQELQEFKELLGTDPQEAASQLGAAQDQACHLQSELDSVHAKEAELQELREKYTALESEVTEQRRRAACLSNELTQLRAAQSAQPNPALAQQQVQPQQQRRRRHVGWLGTTQEADEEKGEAAESSASARNMQLSEMEGFRLCPRRIHVALNFTDRNLAKAGESLSNKAGARAAMMAYLSFVHSALIVFATLSYA
jgi:chromosome segregation ATPase